MPVRSLAPVLFLLAQTAEAQTRRPRLAWMPALRRRSSPAAPRIRPLATRVMPLPCWMPAAASSRRCGWTAIYGIMAFAIAKAEPVAAWGFPTAAMAEAARETPGFGSAPNVVTVAGGVPVFSADGRERIGAVGVSGEAPADDAACAEAGIRAAGLRTARAG